MFKSIEHFKEYCEKAQYIKFDIYYSERLNRIVLAYRGRVVTVVGDRGIFFCKHGYIGKSFVKVGNL
jgi:hypothetical protein